MGARNLIPLTPKSPSRYVPNLDKTRTDTDRVSYGGDPPFPLFLTPRSFLSTWCYTLLQTVTKKKL